MDPNQLDAAATADKLARIHEQHLALIPFENLLQHGANQSSHGLYGPDASLDVDTTARKILDCKRGGFCYEVNTLLAAFLTKLGYRVLPVAATVHVGAGPTGFRDKATHIILIVWECTQRPYFVDVGFGEPPLHPLDYTLWNQEQLTPEGMRSRLVRTGEDEVQLQWYHSQCWHPRLKWSYSTATQKGSSLSDFAEGLRACQSPSHRYSQKVITTLLTRHHKITLAGSRLKTTTPRFYAGGEQGNKEIRQLGSVDEACHILLKEFGMPRQETQGLSLEKSNQAAESIWSHY